MSRAGKGLSILAAAICCQYAIAQESSECSAAAPAEQFWEYSPAGGTSIIDSQPQRAYSASEAYGRITNAPLWSGYQPGPYAYKCEITTPDPYDPQWEIDGFMQFTIRMRCGPNIYDGSYRDYQQTFTYYRHGDQASCPVNFRYTGNWTEGTCVPNLQTTICPDPELTRGKPKECGEGNPIDRSTGNKFQEERDFQGVGPFPLEFSRYYNSSRLKLGRRLGVGGKNWTGTYSRAVVPMSGGRIAVDLADGSTIKFENQSGSLVSLNDPAKRLMALAGGGWKLSGNDEVDEYYDASGRLLRLQHRTGLAHVVSYNANNVPATVTDSFGRTLTFEYRAYLVLARMTDTGGGTFVFEPNADGYQMGKVTYPDGSSRSYVYDETAYAPNAWNLLTGIVDENSARFATFRYDAQGRATSTEHGAGIDQHTLAYDPAGQTLTTDPLGSQRTHGFRTYLKRVLRTAQSQPAGAGCLASNSATSFDDKGLVLSRSDFNGTKTCFSNNSRGLDVVRVEGGGTSVDCTALIAPAASLPAGARKVVTEWHPDWALKAKEASPGILTTNVYNGQPDPTNGGALASCAPSGALLPDGKPIVVLCKQVEQATTDVNGSLGFGATVDATVQSRVWSYTYNQVGQMLTSKGPRTDVDDTTTYTYYADVTTDHAPGDLQKVRNAAGHETRYTKYDKAGRVLQSIDATNTTTDITYKPRGWVNTVIVTPASGAARIASYEYDALGQLKKTTLPDASFLAYSYDYAHRVTQVMDQSGNQITYTLDSAGNKTSETIKDASGTLVRRVTRVFDALGRMQQVSGAAQ